MGITNTDKGEKWPWEGYGRVNDLSKAFMGSVDIRGMLKDRNN